MTEKNKSVKKFPNLRFPGFEGEWKMTRLGELTKLITKGTTPKKFVSEGVKFIKIECFDGDKINSQKCLYIDKETHQKELRRSILKEDDLLFAIAGATIGKTNIVTNEILPANTNQALAIIRLNPNENTNFIYQILKSDIMQKYIKDSISVGAQPNLNLQQMNDFSFYHPSLSEQSKISSLLNTIDERIQTQKKIIEQLETLMKVNLEKIFCQKLRFKNKQGNYFSDWRTTTLNEICDIKKGEQLNKDDLTETGNYPCLNGGMGFSGYTDKFNSDENTITISEGGNSCGFVSFMKSKFWLGGHCYKLILKKDISTNFFYHLLKFYEREIMNLRVGSGLPNIQQKDLKNLQLLVSKDIEEQTEIANFLSSIQEKTETEKQILKKLDLQKKHLLSNLFI